jgi:hypothetical protein
MFPIKEKEDMFLSLKKRIEVVRLTLLETKELEGKKEKEEKIKVIQEVNKKK